MQARLFKAIESKEHKLFESLLDQATDLIDQKLDGKTLLHFAVEQRNAEAVKILVAHGASLNIKDNNFKTPYQIATDNDAWGIASIFIKHGRFSNDMVPADLWSKNRKVYDLLTYGYNLLLAGAPLESLISVFHDKYGLELLRLSMHHANPKAIKYLYENHHEAFRISSDGESLFHLAIEKDGWDVINYIFLVNPHPACETREAQGLALIRAAQHGKHALAEHLLLRGASVDYKSFSNGTKHSAAEWAVINDDEVMAALLIHYDYTKTLERKIENMALSYRAWNIILSSNNSKPITLGNYSFTVKSKKKYIEALFNQCQKQMDLHGKVSDTLIASVNDLIKVYLSANKKHNYDVSENFFLIGSGIFRLPMLFGQGKIAYQLALVFFTLAGEHPQAKKFKFYCYLSFLGMKGLYQNEEIEGSLKDKFSKSDFEYVLSDNNLLDALEYQAKLDSEYANNELGEIFELLEDYKMSYQYSIQAASCHSRASIARLIRFSRENRLPEVEGLYYEALAHHLGIETPQNNEIAIELLLEAVKKKSAPALLYLGNILNQESANYRARRALAMLYRDGTGVTRDYQLAAQWAFIKDNCTVLDEDAAALLSDPQIRRNLSKSFLTNILINNSDKCSSELLIAIASENLLIMCAIFATPQLLNRLSFDDAMTIFNLDAKQYLNHEVTAEFLIHCAKQQPLHRGVKSRDIKGLLENLRSFHKNKLAETLESVYFIVTLLNDFTITPDIKRSLSTLDLTRVLELIREFPIEYHRELDHIRNIINYYSQLKDVSKMHHKPGEIDIKISEMKDGIRLFSMIDESKAKNKYERKGEVRKHAFNTLVTSVRKAESDEEKLSILKSARSNPTFCEHRSRFKFGRTKAVKKIEDMILEISKRRSNGK